jgi:hypothetical protein
LTSQIPISKSQITNKFQIQNLNATNPVLTFELGSLDIVWNLVLGAWSLNRIIELSITSKEM